MCAAVVLGWRRDEGPTDRWCPLPFDACAESHLGGIHAPARNSVVRRRWLRAPGWRVNGPAARDRDVDDRLQRVVPGVADQGNRVHSSGRLARPDALPLDRGALNHNTARE
jgi:hypothetical protein